MTRTVTYFDKDMAEPEFHQLDGGGLIGVFTATCPESAGPNEDAAAVILLDDQTAVLVVADGMGGGAAGEKASSLAIRAIATAIEKRSEDDEQPLRSTILNGIETANAKIQELGVGAATTLAVVEFRGESLRSYHVGDSPIFVVGNRGRIKLQTVAHSPVGYAVEAGILDHTDAMLHEERHVVSNMVGMPDMRIEVGSERKLALRDTVLVASDGLADNMLVEEIVAAIRKGPMAAAIAQLRERVAQRMSSFEDDQPSKRDDVTLILFRRSGKPR